MVHKLTPLRPSLTALTAVLVLSATPAFAQTTDATTSPAPITIAPPAPAPTVTTDAPAATTPDATPAPTVDTTSNMSAQDSAAPATSPAPAAPMATRSPVVVHTTADTSDAAPTAAPVATAKVARTAKPAPVAESKPAPAPAPVAKVVPAPVPAPQPEAAPAQPAPVTSNKTVATSTTHDETGLYAGLGGAAALLLIGGGAFAISRRRKDEDEADDYVAAEPVIVPAATRVEPTYEPAVASVATPVTESAPIGESTLPEGFDLSRFGPHTQAAYRGPTEDNPSYSLKKRLKIASFRDGRLRQGLETDVPVPTQQAVQQEAPSRTILGSKLTDKLSFRPSRPRQSFRPATA